MSQQKPCLAIPQQRRRKRDDDDDDGTPTNFDDIDSLDATGYLSRVMEQASRLPEVFESEPAARSPLSSTSSSRKKFKKVDDDTAQVITGSAASLHFLVSSSSGAIQPPPTTQHLPAGGLQWVEQTMASFSDLRSYLEQCHDQGVGRDKSQRVPVPPMKDRMGWYSFCVGPDAASGNVGGYYDDDDDRASDKDDSDEDAGKDRKDKEAHGPAWKRNGPPPAGGYTPTVSLLLQLDQVMVRRVLGHLTHYYCCDNHNNTHNTPIILPQLAAWLYALCARLERPIHRDDAVTLYSLLKALTAARAAVAAPQRREIATLNVLIVVVGIYFEQGGGYANVMEVKE